MPPRDSSDLPNGVLPILACPVCKGPLVSVSDALRCESCLLSYPAEEGIPRLLAPQDPPTLDPTLVHIKTREEVGRTLVLRARIESGFIARPRWFYGFYALLLGALVLRLPLALGGLGACLFADWVVYRSRRGRVLGAYRRNPLRVCTAADSEVLDRAFEERHMPPPSMADCVQLLSQSSGGRDCEERWKPQAAERYLDILRVLESRPEKGRVVVDVGANDGQACWEFGIGRDRTYIGIDVNRPLLRELKRRLPNQVAIQGDGSCLPLAGESVDFLFCTETLEHIPDPGAAVREFIRVLRPGGCLVVQSPNAHRLRNLNPFEFLTAALSPLSDRILQPKMVHENTWVNVMSYHWDFSTQDFRRMLAGCPMRILWQGSREFVFPPFLLRGSVERFRQKERALQRLPIIKCLGGDLMIVVEKPKEG